jgi:hypothetical protein
MEADHEQLRVPDGVFPPVRTLKPLRPVKNVICLDNFLRGPISLAWLSDAIRLPGKTWAVGLLLWHVVALQRAQKRKIVRLGHRERQWYPKFHLHRNTVYRGLRRLEQAGLVRVQAQRGMSVEVTLLVPASCVVSGYEESDRHAG